MVLALIYVDDIIVTRNNTKMIEDTILKLKNTFALKDIRNLHYFLGIEVKKEEDLLTLSQEKY